MLNPATKQNKKGYTLLFAVLVSALILAIGISILNVSKKEFLIATSARDSSEAFYSADAGIECAAYWDNKGTFSDGNLGNLKCEKSYSYKSTIYIVNNGITQGTFVFHLGFDGSAGSPCAIVTVKKTIVGNTLVTTIDSKGYNTGWNPGDSSCSLQSARRVERALRLTN